MIIIVLYLRYFTVNNYLIRAVHAHVKMGTVRKINKK